jgi:outer membrane receptor for monomeric catechols
MKLDLDGNSQDQVFYNDEGKTPQQQVSLRTQYHLTDRLSFNNTFHYVDELPSLHISDYLKWDSNLVWSAQDNLRITLAGENLADAAHSEFSEPLYGDVAEVSRAFYVRLELDL